MMVEHGRACRAAKNGASAQFAHPAQEPRLGDFPRCIMIDKCDEFPVFAVHRTLLSS